MSYDLAGTCVFGKQSLEVFRCGPRKRGQALSRSYGRFFAEFLKDLSLVRLGLLDLTTCVGLGTVPLCLCLEVFLGSVLPFFDQP